MKQLVFKKTDRFLKIMIGFVVVLLFVQFVRQITYRSIHNKQIEQFIEQASALDFINKTRNSLDNLTKMARLYIVTGKDKYRELYFEIKNNALASKDNMSIKDSFYWDTFFLQNQNEKYDLPIEYIELKFNQQKFSKDQKIYFTQFSQYENQLSDLSFEAVNAFQGKYKDSQGNYTIEGSPNKQLAESLIFSDEYIDINANAMNNLRFLYYKVIYDFEKDHFALEKWIKATFLFSIIISVTLLVLFLIISFRTVRFIQLKNTENEILLLNILPKPIADRLKEGEEKITDEYSEASVIFCDIVGFTEKTEMIGSKKMIDILNDLFDEYDDLCEKYKIEKIKTIGDCYMAVSGVPTPREDHAQALAEFSLEMKKITNEFSLKINMDLKVRIGMTSGKVIAGVIGHKKFIYDLWGDVVNIASRMESTGISDEIQVSEKMANLLMKDFELEPRGPVKLKGIGVMNTFLLKKKKGSTNSP